MIAVPDRAERAPTLSRFAAVALVAVAATSACSAEPTPAPAADINYTCCDAKDVDKLYRPGQTMTIHWAASPNSRRNSANPQDTVLEARLTGPYANVGDLKAATPDTRTASGDATYAAAPVRPTGEPGEQPVSTIVIRADAVPGYYSLLTSVSIGHARVGGGSVVQVVAKTG